MNALLKIAGAAVLAAALAVPAAYADSTVTAPGGTTSGTYMDYMKTVYDRAGAPELTSLPLTEFDSEYQLNPMGAKSWTQSADGLTWTFKLHPNVKWHDGTPFTADDVAFSLELCIDPNAGGCDRGSQLTAIKGGKEYAAGTAKSVEGIKVVDPTTIEITTAAPFAPLLDVLTETWILQKASVGAIARDKIKGNDYWFSRDGRTYVAFRVLHGVALTIGDPVGPASARCS